MPNDLKFPENNKKNKKNKKPQNFGPNHIHLSLPGQLRYGALIQRE